MIGAKFHICRGIVLFVHLNPYKIKSRENCLKRFVYVLVVKGIVSDSNNIFLWHESEDINKKSLFPKFQLIPMSRFQVMHNYVCFIAPIDFCVE